MSGPFGAGALNLFSGVKKFYPFEIDQSLRFNDNDSAYLQKNFSGLSGGNRRTFTVSFWFKRCRTGTAEYLFAGGDDTSNRFHMDINASGTFQIEGKSAGGTDVKMEGGPVLRDVGAWYHFVLRVDTTQSTASNRVRLYVNGDLLTFNSNTFPGQNFDLNWNINDQVRIGRAGWDTNYFDGYFAEFINVDGQSLAPTSFGETKAGIWIPKEYDGSYGTYGFKLSFQDSSNLGDDTSGNGNDFTSHNLAATDQVLDSPTNNFCTLNPLDNDSMTLSEGNLQAISPANAHNGVGSTFSVTGGKWYWEIESSGTGSKYFFGMARSTFQFIRDYTNDAHNFSDLWCVGTDGNKANGSGEVSYGSTLALGDVLMLAFDLDNGKFYAGKNGTFYNSGDPAAGTNAAFTNVPTDEAMSAFFGNSTSGLSHIFNFGQDSTFLGSKSAGGNSDANGNGDFQYAPPSGFLALCTANLPNPAIDPNNEEAADDYFNTVLYTGNNATAQSITGVGFQPDFLWFKQRNRADEHPWFDVIRGAGNYIRSNRSNAEGTDATGLTSFDSDGFSLGTDGAGWLNQGTDSMVAWAWKAGGTAVNNTDGSIASSVSVSNEAGFSIVTYTGSGANATVGHGLSAAPKAIFIKRRSTSQSWFVYHDGLNEGSTPQDFAIKLNLQDAQFNDATAFNDTAPTTSVFSLGSGGANGSSETHVAYCFAEILGYSKFGQYNGTSSSDGAFIHTGFRPAWILYKRTNDTGQWVIRDNKRDVDNPNEGRLLANSNDAENTPAGDKIDFLSNGFKLRSNSFEMNHSGSSYIYFAFAEQPFKYANAR